MPLEGEFSGRRCTPRVTFAIALLLAFTFCYALPRLASAAPRSHARGHHARSHHARHARSHARGHAASQPPGNAASQPPGNAAGQTGSRSNACANAGASATGTPIRELRNAVVCLVNQQRAHYHLPPLREVPQLINSAQSYAAQMVRDDSFSHTGPGGSTPGARISAAGFRWSWIGENIASGFTTPLSVVTGWMGSQGHCSNILSPEYTDIGVGVTPHAIAPAIDGATWTQDFGLPMGSRAPSGNWGPANSCAR